MCFSAEASFIASGGLILSGVATQRYRVVGQHEQPLAVVPFLFAAQQFSEGLVWLGISGAIPAALQLTAIYFFSFFAFVFWPVYVPSAMSRFEQSGLVSYIRPLQVLGLAVALYYLWCFTVYSQLTVEVICESNRCGSLAYIFQLPYFSSMINYAYLLVAGVPFFLTKNQKVRWGVGPAFLISFFVTKFISMPPAFPSVWCFLAANVSLFLFFSFKKKHCYDNLHHLT